MGYTLILIKHKVQRLLLSSRNPLTVLKHQTIYYPLQKWNQEVGIFPPKQYKTDDESIVNKKLQVRANFNLPIVYFLTSKKFSICFLSLHPLQNSHTSSNQRSIYKLLCNTWKAHVLASYKYLNKISLCHFK